jgi:hypothetical protein
MEAKLHLYVGGTVKARLDRPLFPSSVKARRKRVTSSLASTLPPM